METVLVLANYVSDIENDLLWQCYKWRHLCAATRALLRLERTMNSFCH